MHIPGLGRRGRIRPWGGLVQTRRGAGQRGGDAVVFARRQIWSDHLYENNKAIITVLPLRDEVKRLDSGMNCGRYSCLGWCRVKKKKKLRDISCVFSVFEWKKTAGGVEQQADVPTLGNNPGPVRKHSASFARHGGARHSSS